MNVSSLMPHVGYNRTRALVLEQLLHWNGTTNQRDEHGRPVIVPLLRSLGKVLDRSKAALSKAITWLADHGFLSVHYVKRGNAWRLQIRVLIRPKTRPAPSPAERPEGGVETVPKRCGNGEETVILCSDIPLHTPPSEEEGLGSENSEISGEVSLSPELDTLPEKSTSPQAPLQTTTRMGFHVSGMSRLRGKVAGAASRLARGATERAEKRPSRPPTPTEAAHEWNRLLRAYGDDTFPVDGKNLSHVKRTLAHVDPETMVDFLSRLTSAVERWYMLRPQNMKKVSAHPWALNRHKAVMFNTAPPVSVQETPQEAPATLKPLDLSSPKPHPDTKPPSGGLLHLFSKPKKKYKGGTSTSEED